MDPALEALRAALEEYLAQGGDTPVAPEAQALMDAIDAGGAPTEGGMEPPPVDDAAGGAMPPMDEAGMGDMPPAQPDAKTFGDANAGAAERLKKLNRR